MFRLFVSILVIVAEITTDIYCSEQIDISQKIPETKEEWRELCDTENNLIHIKEACNESSPLYADIVNNLQCLREFDKENYIKKCERQMKLIPGVRGIITGILIEDGLIPHKDKFRKHWCIDSAVMIACYATNLEEKCGTNAVELQLTYAKFLGKIGILKPPKNLPVRCEVGERLIPDIFRHYKLIKKREQERVLSITTKPACNDDDNFKVCRLHNNIPQEIPETHEELQKVCNAAVHYFACYLKLTNKCEHVNNTTEYFYRKTVENLVGTIEVCEKSSPLYTDIVDNLKCFSEFHKEDYFEKCTSELDHDSNAQEKFYKEYSNFFMRKKLLPRTKKSKILSSRRRCFYQYQLITCYAKNLEVNCGRRAAETYLRVIHKISYLGPPQIMLECEVPNYLIQDIYSSLRRKGVINLAPDCYVSSSKFCQKENLPRRTPETIEELQKLCNASLDFSVCYLRHDMKCGFDPRYINEAIAYLIRKEHENMRGIQEVCKESSPLYAALVDNLKCFSEFDKEDYMGKCFAEIPYENGPKFYVPDELYNQVTEIRMEERRLMPENRIYRSYISKCIYYYKVIACCATKLEEQCGTNAMETYLSVIQKISNLGPEVWVYGCEDAEHLIPEIIRLYKLHNTEEEISVYFVNIFNETLSMILNMTRYSLF